MKRIALCLAIGVISASGAAGASLPGLAAVISCPPRHGFVYVLKSDREAVVYEGLDHEGLNDVYGCARGATRRSALGILGGTSETGGEGLRRFTLAGAVVAYEEYAFNGPGYPERSFNVVVVRNLRTARVLHRLPTGPSARPEGVGRGPTLVRIIVKSDGAVAWMTGGTVQGITMTVIHVVDRSGSRVVASGTGIERQSLRLRGSTLSWKQNGRLTAIVLQ